MTTLTDRTKTALLVIDVQNDVVGGSHNRDDVVANIATLVDKARADGVPVVWVQHSGDDLPRDSDGWQYVARAEATGLRAGRAQALRRLLRGHRPRVGARRARGRQPRRRRGTDRRVHPVHPPRRDRPRVRRTLVEDAHTTEDLSDYGAPPPDQVIAHTNLYWKYHTAPGRTAGTVTTAEVDFG